MSGETFNISGGLNFINTGGGNINVQVNVPNSHPAFNNCPSNDVLPASSCNSSTSHTNPTHLESPVDYTGYVHYIENEERKERWKVYDATQNKQPRNGTRFLRWFLDLEPPKSSNKALKTAVAQHEYFEERDEWLDDDPIPEVQRDMAKNIARFYAGSTGLIDLGNRDDVTLSTYRGNAGAVPSMITTGRYIAGLSEMDARRLLERTVELYSAYKIAKGERSVDPNTIMKELIKEERQGPDKNLHLLTGWISSYDAAFSRGKSGSTQGTALAIENFRRTSPGQFALLPLLKKDRKTVFTFFLHAQATIEKERTGTRQHL